MKQRILTGIVILAIFVPALIFSYTPVFAVLFTVLALVGTYEMLKCVGTSHELPIAIPAFLYTAVICFSAKFFLSAGMFKDINEPRDLFAWTYIGATFVYFICVSAACLFSRGKHTVDDLFASFGGVFYVGSAFASIILLRESFLGEYLCILAIFLPWGSDTFAYFTGVLFGKHKLAPHVSPKKTVEGSLGAVVLCGVFSMLFAFIVLYLNGKGASLWQYIAIFFAGGILSAVSQVGDLIASLIKRKYDVKDYGFLFPGHGGVVDRFDSVLLSAPLFLLVSFVLKFIEVHALV